MNIIPPILLRGIFWFCFYLGMSQTNASSLHVSSSFISLFLPGLTCRARNRVEWDDEVRGVCEHEQENKNTIGENCVANGDSCDDDDY